MERINTRDVNQEIQKSPLRLMSPSSIENQAAQDRRGQGVDNMDPKKLKRVAASREYSQRYRLKQLQYIAQLETEVRALQAEVAISYPRIKYGDTQISLLRAENDSMRQKLSALSGELMLKEAEYHELKKERDALKQMSSPYQSVPYPDISQTKHYSYQQLLNIALDPPRFNQFTEAAAAGASNMWNQNLDNHLESDANNGDNNRNPI